MRELKIVRWIDSALQNGQVDSKDFPKPAEIISVGFQVVDNDDHIVLARDDMGDGDYRGLIAIPRKCIREEKHGFTEDRSGT